MGEVLRISHAVAVLETNLSEIARVVEWAELMGYDCPKKFARKFLRYYQIRPQKMLEYIRLKSVLKQLREGRYTNFEIARNHGIPDEIALNKFVNYHIGCSPRKLKMMSSLHLSKKMNGLEEKMGSNIR